MLTTMFDIKYYKNIWVHVICMQVLAHFIPPPPDFDRVSIISMLLNFFLDNDMQPLLSVSFHIQCVSFNLEQQQPASYCYLLRK